MFGLEIDHRGKPEDDHPEAIQSPSFCDALAPTKPECLWVREGGSHGRSLPRSFVNLRELFPFCRVNGEELWVRI